MADGSRQSFRRPFIFLIAALRQKPRMFPAPPSYEHLAFVAYEDDAVLGIEFAILFKFRGPLWKHSAIVPMQFHRRQIASRWKLIMHACREWNSFCEHRCGAGANRVGRAQFEG